jgi:demethylmenaquinone methyltransferase/2-methoxy-6-polyprenyl-1,4-benzoquinol methylase
MLNRTFSITKTQNNFSKVVSFYDSWGKFTEKKGIDTAISLSGLSNKMKVLDVGVGTGQLFEKIIRLNQDGVNTGIDLSFSMIKKASDKLKLQQENLLLVSGNAFKLPYKDEQFDFIFSSYMFDLLPEIDFKYILSEFRRVMKSGGLGIIITMAMGNKWYNKIWYLMAKYFPSLLTNCRPVQLVEYIDNSKFQITTKENISQNTFPSEIIKFQKLK